MTTPAAPTTDGRLLLVRHGQTTWSATGRHTGFTDVPLTDEGERLATGLGAALAGYDVVAAFTSPRVRARRTAQLAGLEGAIVLEDLREWDYGGYEGLSTPQIRRQRGDDWEIFRDGVVPGGTPGESVEEVAARAQAVLEAVDRRLAEGDVVLVAHGHLLRVLTAVRLGQPPRFAAHLELDPGTLSVLGEHHDIPTVRVWNQGVTAPGASSPAAG